MNIQNHKKMINLSGLALAIAFLSGCGGGGSAVGASENWAASDHVADPDPQNAFFSDETKFSFLDSMGEMVSGVASDVSAVLPSDQVEASGSRVRTAQAVTNDRYDCQSGSIDSAVDTTETAASTQVSAVAEFNDCIDGDVQANGSVSINGNVATTDESVSGRLAFNFDNLVVVGEESMSVNGALAIDITDADDWFTIVISSNAITWVVNDDTIRLENYRLSLANNAYTDESVVSGGFTVFSTEHGTLTISIESEFKSQGGDVSEGSLRMTHADGSYLIIDADTGDVATVNYTVHDGMATSSGTASESDFPDLDFSFLTE